MGLAACASLSGSPAGGAGSGSAAPTAARPGINLSGYSVAFKEGYADGCETARQAPRRNAKRYGTDADYTMGWNDGQAMCKR